MLDAAHLGGGSHFEVWVANAFYYPGTRGHPPLTSPQAWLSTVGSAAPKPHLSRHQPAEQRHYLHATSASGNTDDCYTAVTPTNPDNSTVVDGFYIARCGHNDDTGHGGGMVIDAGFAAVIRNCDFTTNGAPPTARGHLIPTVLTHASLPQTAPAQRRCLERRRRGDRSSWPHRLAHGSKLPLSGRNNAIGEGAGRIYTSTLNSDIANRLFSGNTTQLPAGAIRAAEAHRVR